MRDNVKNFGIFVPDIDSLDAKQPLLMGGKAINLSNSEVL
jgi:hypothetical protein